MATDTGSAWDLRPARLPGGDGTVQLRVVGADGVSRRRPVPVDAEWPVRVSRAGDYRQQFWSLATWERLPEHERPAGAQAVRDPTGRPYGYVLSVWIGD